MKVTKKSFVMIATTLSLMTVVACGKDQSQPGNKRAYQGSSNLCSAEFVEEAKKAEVSRMTLNILKEEAQSRGVDIANTLRAESAAKDEVKKYCQTGAQFLTVWKDVSCKATIDGETRMITIDPANPEFKALLDDCKKYGLI